MAEAERQEALRALRILDTPRERHFDVVCEMARARFGVPLAMVSLIDSDRLWFKAAAGTTLRQVRRPPAGLCLDVAATGGPHVVGDTLAHASAHDHPLVAGEAAIRFYAGAPLVLRDGLVLGTLCLLDTHPREFPAQDLAALTDLAAIVVAHLRLYEAQALHAEDIAQRRRDEALAREQARTLAARETALREANRMLTLAERVAHVGHWHVDIATEERRWSRGAFAIYGLPHEGRPPTREELIAHYRPDDQEMVCAAMARGRREKGAYEFQAMFLRSDGTERSVLVRGNCECDAAGELVAIFGIVMDLTESRRTEDRLRDTAALLRTTLETMDQGLMSVAGDGRIAVFNGRAAELLELPPEFLEARPHFREVRRRQRDQGDFAICSPELRAWMETGGIDAPSPLYERVRPNGTVLEVRTVPLGDGGVVRTYADVTAQRQVEAALRQQTALLDATLENMDQGLFMIDAEGVLQVCNERAIALLDLPPDLARSKPPFAAIIAHQNANGEFAGASAGKDAWLKISRDILGAPQVYERVRPNGTVLEVRTVRLDGGGAVRTFTDITERKAAERRVAYMAGHDALTGLPNRSLFREHFEAQIAAGDGRAPRLAMHCIDLDRFKAVNDTLGHPAGDTLLKVMAARLAGLLRGGDMVARLGGDEFAILQVGVEGPEDAEALAGRLVAAIGEAVSIDGTSVTVGASIGIALLPAHGRDADTVFKRADLALYRAKAEGRNTLRFFEPGMDAALEARERLGIDLRLALQRGEFALHYQPIVEVAGRHVVGQEALVRWHHPVRGLVPPSDFIPVAEETGVIAALGEWVLRTAARDARRLPAGQRIAVNVSPSQFRHAGFLRTVRAALDAAEVPGTRLEIEITESLLMGDSERVRDELHALQGLGVQIAMDDFGTGYSSLSYLRRFPFDRIKIDRSFIADIANPETAAIVSTIVDLARHLGMRVTAEGIETDEQLAAVRAKGCSEAQGYLIGRPRPLDAVLDAPPGAVCAA